MGTLFLFFLFSFILGFLFSFIDLSNISQWISNTYYNRRRIKYLSKWDGLYVDYYKVIKVIESSYTSRHYLSCNKLVRNFKRKYKSEIPKEKNKREIYNKKSLDVLNLYNNLYDKNVYHFRDKLKVKKAKEAHMGENIKRYREIRLDKLLDEDE